ncbi:D-ribose pyranase [Thermoanaerobacterium sp. DL9XJH110]|uniref:D-ribose pyranase n=1 Tax=Thermoanaerobacterium sp. DL9XJH110 TaxID=3386643 RepID=UPI003BB6A86E
MKKNPLLNSEISYIISRLGHTDTIVIADAGLPIPDNVRRIDLALVPGMPSFLDTLEAVLTELKVESAVVASEMKQKSPGLYSKIKESLKNVAIGELSHEEFKRETARAKAVIRTGEFTPYANIILQAGVMF